MFGFKRLDNINEHTFAKLLRKHKAIDNCQSIGSSNVWYGPDGKSIALCIYKGEGGMDCEYWLREHLAE